MKRNQARPRLIGLGAATAETKGAAGILVDEVLTQPFGGLEID